MGPEPRQRQTDGASKTTSFSAGTPKIVGLDSDCRFTPFLIDAVVYRLAERQPDSSKALGALLFAGKLRALEMMGGNSV